MCFCSRQFNFNFFFIFLPFLASLITISSQKLCICKILHCPTNNCSLKYQLHVFIEASFETLKVSEVKPQPLLPSAETCMPEDSKACINTWFFLRYQLISPRLPTELFPPRSMLKILLVYRKFTRKTYHEICCLLS